MLKSIPFTILILVSLANFDLLHGGKYNDLNSLIKSSIVNTDIPSMVAAVLVNGKFKAAGAFGVRKRNNKKKVTVKDKYHIGSCTKSMTATLAAILVERKKVSWNTKIEDIFKKEFFIHEEYKSVTLIQLLSNTGGVPGKVKPKLWRELWLNKGSAKKQRLLLSQKTLKDKPKYIPGKGYEYSNAGFAIAGAMLEKVEKSSWEEMMVKYIFKPLKMSTAGFRAPLSTTNIGQPWGHNPNPVQAEPAGDNPRGIAPAGAVHCSVLDLAKYVKHHLLRKTNVILKRKSSYKILHTPKSPKKDYALGWCIAKRKWAGGITLNHDGSNTMWYCVIWIAPKRNFSVITMTNFGGKLGFQKCDEVISKIIEKYL